MKIKSILLLSCITLLLLSACSNSNNYSEDFSKYIRDNYNAVVSKGNDKMYLVELPSGNSVFATINKETNKKARSSDINKKYGSNNIIIANLYNQDDSFKSFILDLSIEEFKNDLSVFGDIFVEYAKSIKQDNNYYLLITLYLNFNTVVYDYEKNLLYLPKDIDTYKEMYDKFNTVKIDDIKDMSNGSEWLIKNDFAKSKHGEIELIRRDYYNVYISKNEFGEYGVDTVKPY